MWWGLPAGGELSYSLVDERRYLTFGDFRLPACPARQPGRHGDPCRDPRTVEQCACPAGGRERRRDDQRGAGAELESRFGRSLADGDAEFGIRRDQRDGTG